MTGIDEEKYDGIERVTAAEAVRRLDAIDPAGDPEAGHDAADNVLLSFAPVSVRRAYARVMGRAPWWAAS